MPFLSSLFSFRRSTSSSLYGSVIIPLPVSKAWQRSSPSSLSPPPNSSITDEVSRKRFFFYSSDVTLLTALSKVATKLQTAGYATLRRLSTCMMYCSAHTGSNAGWEGNGFQLKDTGAVGGRGCEEHISSSNSSANDSKWNVWWSRSMGFRKFVLFFFSFSPRSLSSYSLVNRKWEMRLRAGEMMSCGDWGKKSKRMEEVRRAERRSGPPVGRSEEREIVSELQRKREADGSSFCPWSNNLQSSHRRMTNK